MIKKLRRKFILITMIVITTVVFMIVGFTNFASVGKSIEETDKVIDVIAQNNGEMPMPDSSKPDEFGGMQNNLPIETPFKTRYFTVKESENIVTIINTKNIFDVSDEDAIEAVNSIKGSKGFYKTYRYKVISSDSSNLYIFVECEDELIQMKHVFLISSIVGFLSIVLILVLIIIGSKIAVKPIAESYEKQKRFITDANHELKTPLTIISANNEILEMKYGENEWSDTIDNQVKRLTDLTEKLVMLSKMDESIKIEMTNVSLSSLTNEIADEFNAISESTSKKYEINIESGIERNVSKEMYERLVRLLLDNAFKYSLSYVNIKLEQVGKKTKLVISNDASNVTLGEHNELFERFYRPDESRNSKTGGSGIGLSVALQIAEVHKGTLKAYSLKDNNLTLEFIF